MRRRRRLPRVRPYRQPEQAARRSRATCAFPCADRLPIDGAGLHRTVGLVTSLPTTDSHTSGLDYFRATYWKPESLSAGWPLLCHHQHRRGSSRTALLEHSTAPTLIARACKIYLEKYSSTFDHDGYIFTQLTDVATGKSQAALKRRHSSASPQYIIC